MKVVLALFIAVFLTLMGCAHGSKSKSDKLAATKTSAEDDERTQKRLIEKLEREKADLEIQNQILIKALSEKKRALHKLPKGEVVQQFPEFEELIFDQAKTAYREKDEERLQEAIRIMSANQPNSQTRESMFFWLAKIQEEKGHNSQALVTYNEFVKNFPNSEYAPQAMFLKAKLYEKLNLKPQAMKIYSEIRIHYPHSREKHFADSILGNELKPRKKK